MKKLKVVSSNNFISKRTGKPFYRVVALGEDGICAFFASSEDAPSVGDIYVVDVYYSAKDFTYKVSYKKA